jgi:redox-sensitive bicupin YhaK (pirin superfamily)
MLDQVHKLLAFCCMMMSRTENMDETRKISKVLSSRPTVEGAGVNLRMVFGNNDAPQFDPFLLLDDFRSNNPADYVAGFPWHPHRGIETITYVLTGSVEHRDSMGNRGVIGAGDVQWMTAGSGIIHQEMPKGDSEGRMGGFQLWANLPASQKMMPPRYREVLAEQIPVITDESGTTMRIISGEVNGVKGPVQDIITEPVYIDVTVSGKAVFSHPIPPGHTLVCYVIEGSGYFDSDHSLITEGKLVQFGDGQKIVVRADGGPVRFLLISGKPIGEPVVWYGPIVMNTEEEIRTALTEYQNGKFIKI